MTVVLADVQALWMFLLGCALLTLILLKRSYRYFGRRRRSSSSPIERQHRPDSAWDGAKRDAMAQVERQEVEMHQMARDINGQLSSKIVILEQLIADSQRQIDRMEHLLGQLERTPQSSATTGESAPSVE